MKLTDTQKEIICQLLSDSAEAKRKLDLALVLIVGRPFKSYTITGDELTIVELDETK